METSKFLPGIDRKIFDEYVAAEKTDDAFDLLTQPLHAELYERGTFAFVQELTTGQQLLITYDYVRMQVGQGGFIQLIQNGYTPLLLTVIEGLQTLQISPEMATVLDDVLKVYVLNKEALEAETSVDEFAKLYNEFKEFEALDDRFNILHPAVMQAIVAYAAAHFADFAMEL